MKLSKLIIIIFFTLIVIFWISLNSFAQKTNQKSLYFARLVFQSVFNNPYRKLSRFNFLILGLDPRNDSLEKTETTDTVILASLSFLNPKLSLISLPRDLWSYELNTKINGIYPQALESGKEIFPYIQSEFQKFTGQDISRTLIFTTSNLSQLLKLTNGVELYLDKGFRDEQFPNPEYIKNPSSKVPIYITVEFPAGWVHLDENNVAMFVRSRKSAENLSDGGTDLGRIKRQQLLIQAIIDKLKNLSAVELYRILPKLYTFFHQQLNSNFSDQDFTYLAILFNRKFKNLSLNKIELPIGKTTGDGVIYSPNTLFHRQWVFLPSDPEYKLLKKFIQNSL